MVALFFDQYLRRTLPSPSARGVSRVGEPPRGGLRQMPRCAPLVEVKAISSPSGDQIGLSFSNSSRVLGSASPDAACLIQMFLLPPCVEVKATHLPSGENAPML